MQAANLSTDGLLLNADAGFDIQGLRNLFFLHSTSVNIDINYTNGQ